MPDRFNHTGQALYEGPDEDGRLGWDWHSHPVKTQLAKHTHRSTTTETTSLRGGNSAAACRRHRRVAARMMVPGQTRKERRHRKRRSRRGRHPGGVQRAGADASSTATPGGCRVNLRRPFRAGAWNVRTLREDFAICQLSAELSRLRVSVAALSEVRRPGTGQISVGGYTYFWSGSPLGRHTEGVAIAVADALLPAIDDILEEKRPQHRSVLQAPDVCC